MQLDPLCAFLSRALLSSMEPTIFFNMEPRQIFLTLSFQRSLFPCACRHYGSHPNSSFLGVWSPSFGLDDPTSGVSLLQTIHPLLGWASLLESPPALAKCSTRVVHHCVFSTFLIRYAPIDCCPHPPHLRKPQVKGGDWHILIVLCPTPWAYMWG